MAGAAAAPENGKDGEDLPHSEAAPAVGGGTASSSAEKAQEAPPAKKARTENLKLTKVTSPNPVVGEKWWVCRASAKIPTKKMILTVRTHADVDVFNEILFVAFMSAVYCVRLVRSCSGVWF